MDFPDGSIYFWMYTQGLKQVDLGEIEAMCSMHGKDIRQKDYDNYWRGWYKSDLYRTDNWESIFKFHRWMDAPSSTLMKDCAYHEFPINPYHHDIEERWVPCNKDNKPMIKWGQGCMGYTDAMSYPNQVYLAENLKGCNRIVIDCDGDHEEKLDLETVLFLWRLSSMTHTLMKPKKVKEYEGYGNFDLDMPASFHLTFEVDRVVPTMHFPCAHIDIVGNRRNSLRYLKNKEWNGIQPAKMTDGIWHQIQNYINYRERKERHA